MIVMKFGGSSVDRAESIQRVAGIVRGCFDQRPVIVVSAMAKTTNRLLQAAEAAAAGDRAAALEVFDELEAYHRRESHGVVPPAGRPALDAALAPFFNDLRTQLDELAATRALTPRAADAVASCGELLASTILSFALTHAGLDAVWIDCRRVMVTDHEFTRARPLYGPTDARLREALLPLLREGKVPVVGGYVGATLQGVTTTLGKEGSDFSAAIVGAALGASEVQIWTDVDGIRTTDPQICPDARRVRSLSFAEALELSCSGTKKPHYGTLGPASRANVPIRILDSRHPGAEGTVIGRRNPDAPRYHQIHVLPGPRPSDLRAGGGLRRGAPGEGLRSVRTLPPGADGPRRGFPRRGPGAEPRRPAGRGPVGPAVGGGEIGGDLGHPRPHGRLPGLRGSRRPSRAGREDPGGL